MRRLALAPLLLAAAACGTDASPTAVAPSATTPVSPPATTPAAPRATKAPVTAPPATTTPVKARPSTPAATPPRARPSNRPVASDVDGDGRRDDVRIAGGSLTTGRWELRVALSGGGTVTGTIHAEAQVEPSILGVADADRDGDGEVFVRVGGGASTTSYTPYTLVEDGMAEVRTPDGKALRLVVGGTVTHGDGFSCADVDPAPLRELVVLSVVANDGETFQGTRKTYRWTDDRVRLLHTKTFSGKQGDPAVEHSYGIDCDSL